MKHPRRFFPMWLAATLILLFTMLLCTCIGSVSIPIDSTLAALWNALWGLPLPEGFPKAVVFSVRLPRSAVRSADRRCSLPVRRSHAGTFAEPAGRRLYAGRVLRRVAGRSGGVGAGDHLPRPALWRHRRDSDRLRVFIASDNSWACLCP